MKLSVKKVTPNTNRLQLEVKDEVIALTACYSAKKGPKEVLDRLNAGAGKLRSKVSDGPDFYFEISDDLGVLLVSPTISTYRNHVSHALRDVVKLVGKGGFSLKK